MQTETPAGTGPVERMVRPADEMHPLVRRLRYRAFNGISPMHQYARDDMIEAAREIERLSAEVAELDALRDKLAGILSRTAIALRGPEPPLTRWSWHDLPDRAAAAIAVIALVQAAERTRIAGLIAQHSCLTLETLEYLETMRQGPTPEEWAELDRAARA